MKTASRMSSSSALPPHSSALWRIELVTLRLYGVCFSNVSPLTLLFSTSAADNYSSAPSFCSNIGPLLTAGTPCYDVGGNCCILRATLSFYKLSMRQFLTAAFYRSITLNLLRGENEVDDPPPI